MKPSGVPGEETPRRVWGGWPYEVNPFEMKYYESILNYRSLVDSVEGQLALREAFIERMTQKAWAEDNELPELLDVPAVDERKRKRLLVDIDQAEATTEIPPLRRCKQMTADSEKNHKNTYVIR